MKKILLTALSAFFFFCATAQNIYLRGSFNTPAYAATQLTQMRGLVNTVTLNTILSGTKDFYFGSADNTYLWRPNTTPIASNTASTWSGSASTNGSLYFVFGRSYTFNLIQNTNVVSVLETAASPVSIPTVAQMPLADVGVNVPVTVSVTTSSAPPSDQNVYLRYSLNSFKTSTLIKVLMSGSTGTATIPAVANGTIVQYYVFTSPLTEAAIATEVTNLTEKVYEVLALKTNGTTLSPYSYRVGTLSNTSATPGSGATIQTNATNFYGIMKSNSTYSYSNRHVYIYPKSVLSPLINGSYINTLTFFREVSFGSALVPGQARFKIYLANTTAANWGSTTSLNWSTATNLGVQVWQGDPASSVGDGSAAQVNFAIPPFLYTGNNIVLMVEYIQSNTATANDILWGIQTKNEVPQYSDNQIRQEYTVSIYPPDFLSPTNDAFSSAHPAITFSGLLVIPVELVRFDGKKDKQSNLLTWQTATERGVKEFALERSADGTTFKNIGTVKAAGNSTSLLTYTFSDNNPLPVSYYRLRTIDLDGKEEISKVIAIQEGKSDKETFAVYPNPTTGLIAIESEGPLSKLVVFNTLGQVVKSVQNINSLKTMLDLSDLEGGVYFIKINDVETRRVLMQH